MSDYVRLKNNCKAKGIKVREVGSRKLADYGGMNDEAAKKLGFKRLKDKTILIDRNMPSKTKYRTLKHEVVEMNLMEKGKSYWNAHLVALRREKGK